MDIWTYGDISIHTASAHSCFRNHARITLEVPDRHQSSQYTLSVTLVSLTRSNQSCGVSSQRWKRTFYAVARPGRPPPCGRPFFLSSTAGWSGLRQRHHAVLPGSRDTQHHPSPVKMTKEQKNVYKRELHLTRPLILTLSKALLPGPFSCPAHGPNILPFFFLLDRVTLFFVRD